MSEQHTTLRIEAGQRRYAIVPAQVGALSLLNPADGPTDPRGRPLICQDLGALLGETQPAPTGRRHALTIDLRRRSVSLLIDRIDSLDQPTPIQPLAPLLTRRLRWPWFLGAVIYSDEPLLVLDLRRIATDVAIGAVSA